jgi:hypothetical protein
MKPTYLAIAILALPVIAFGAMFLRENDFNQNRTVGQEVVRTGNGEVLGCYVECKGIETQKDCVQMGNYEECQYGCRGYKHSNCSSPVDSYLNSL